MCLSVCVCVLIHVSTIPTYVSPLQSPPTLRRWLLAALVLVLLVSVLTNVEAKKKGKSKAVADDDDVDDDSPSTPTPSSSSSSSDPAKEAAAKRRSEAERKKKEKQAEKRSASLRAARQRNRQLAAARAQRAANEAKAKALAKQRADDLVAKKRKADTPEIRKRGHEKLRALLSLSAKSGTRIISFDSSQYQTFVNEGPRPYWLFLSYTALSSAHSCYYCHMAHDALIPAAQAYYERSKVLTSSVLSSNSTADILDSELPVFFANVDMARNAPLFKELNLQGAPNLFFAPPRLGTSTLKSLDFVKNLPQRYRYQIQATMTPNSMLQFLNSITTAHVDLGDAKPSMGDLLTMLLILSGLAYVFFRYGYDILMYLRSVRGMGIFLLIAGFGLYCWCISGGMYNIIRGTQFAETDKEGHITAYVLHDSRDQYAVEGMIIGVLNLACAGVLILINARSFDDTYLNTAGPVKGGKQLSTWQHLKNAISPMLSPGFCLALLAAGWFQVINIYSMSV